MTETMIFYTTQAERDQLIDEQKALGFWILHDDFKILDNKDGETKNRLTFTNVENKIAVKDESVYIDEAIDAFGLVLTVAQKNTIKDRLKRAIGVLAREVV